MQAHNGKVSSAKIVGYMHLTSGMGIVLQTMPVLVEFHRSGESILQPTGVAIAGALLSYLGFRYLRAKTQADH